MVSSRVAAILLACGLVGCTSSLHEEGGDCYVVAVWSAIKINCEESDKTEQVPVVSRAD